MKMLNTILLTLTVLFSSGQSGDAHGIYLSPGVSIWSSAFTSAPALALNPAAPAGKPSFEIQVLSRKLFMIEGLHALDAFAGWHFDTGITLGASIHHLSYTGFRETGGSLAVGKKLSDNWRAGVGFGMSNISITGSSTGKSIFGSFALLRQFKSFTLGGLLIPRQLPQAPGKRAQVRPLWILGIGKDWSSQLYMEYALHWQAQDGVRMSAGMCYQPVPAWRMAIRVLSHPIQYGFETGYQRKQYALRIFSDWHPQLGWSPGVLLAFGSLQLQQ